MVDSSLIELRLLKEKELIKIKCEKCGKEIKIVNWKGQDFLYCHECVNKALKERSEDNKKK